MLNACAFAQSRAFAFAKARYYELIQLSLLSVVLTLKLRRSSLLRALGKVFLSADLAQKLPSLVIDMIIDCEAINHTHLILGRISSTLMFSEPSEDVDLLIRLT